MIKLDYFHQYLETIDGVLISPFKFISGKKNWATEKEKEEKEEEEKEKKNISPWQDKQTNNNKER